MKSLITVILVVYSSVNYASPIKCEVGPNNTIQVTMDIPHPNHAVIYRPTGETVWLQSSPEFIHEQMLSFSQIKTWVISPESKGTVWVNGKATIQSIIKGRGKYHLYIADNTETERENTHYIECYFVVGEK